MDDAAGPAIPVKGLCWAALFAVAGSLSAQSNPTARLLWSTDTITAVALVHPRSIAVASDGKVWVGDDRAGDFRFSSSGSYLGAIPVGSGPGELRGVWAVFQVRGDTMVISDPALRRLSYFRSDGRYIRSEPFQFSNNVHGKVMGLAWYPAGKRVWTSNYPNTFEPRPTEQRAYVWSMNAEGVPADSLIAMPGPQSLIVREEQTLSRLDQPLQQRPFVLFLKDRIAVGFSGNDRIQFYTLDGKHLETVTVPVPAIPTTAADRRQYQDSARAGYFAELRAQQYDSSLTRFFAEKFDRMMGMVTYPSTHPRYDQLLADDRGNLWLLLPSRGPDYRRTWMRMSQQGSILSRVSVPHAGAVFAAVIQQGRLYTSEIRYSDDVARIAVYQLP